jgi:hypothetical protein
MVGLEVIKYIRYIAIIYFEAVNYIGFANKLIAGKPI